MSVEGELTGRMYYNDEQLGRKQMTRASVVFFLFLPFVASDISSGQYLSVAAFPLILSGIIWFQGRRNVRSFWGSTGVPEKVHRYLYRELPNKDIYYQLMNRLSE